MSKKIRKAYALTVSVKPKSTAVCKYSTVSYKGIAFAENPNQAKEMGTKTVLQSFSHYDGSTSQLPLITRDNITVKECKLYADFFATPEKQSDGSNN